jgi:glutamate synthase (NADPH/NADH) small chain
MRGTLRRKKWRLRSSKRRVSDEKKMTGEESGKKKVPMPEQPRKEATKNFREVPLGYTLEMAVKEAKRCLQCKPKPGEKFPPCIVGCPVEVNISGFILAIREERFEDAIRIVKDKNALPAVCGRVCSCENQCEGRCTLGTRFEPVAIGWLERFVADFEREKLGLRIPKLPKPTGKKIAVIGSGPAGLTVAGELAKLGHSVTIFEALHVPGGVLVYGIPKFRLPKDILRAEIDYVKALGVEIKTDVVVGKTITIYELLAKYDAIFIGTGAGLPNFMHIPGENLNGIFFANEFLTRINLMKAYEFPEYDTPITIGEKVATIGAGNVSMDCARSALRLGAKESWIIYRRSEKEVPARKEEVERAKKEGVKFIFLTAPVRYLGDKKGWLKRVECIRFELGEPDQSGRRRPVPIKGSEFLMDVDTVVVAIGQSPNPLLLKLVPELKTSNRGTIVADVEGRTSVERIWAGGDIVNNEATVILAMGAGKTAARSIAQYLSVPYKWPNIA